MSFPSHDFEVGDIVRLRSGTSQQKVLKIRAHTIRSDYLSCRGWYPQKFRAAADFVLIRKQNQTQTQSEEDHTMTKLFKTKDDRYGTLLTKDSRGHYVLEMKGKDGGVEAHDPKNLEEVMPYTVEIKSQGGNTGHIEIPEGSVEVGDIIVNQNLSLAQVMRLDTKNSDPLKGKSYRKVGTSEVK